MNRFSQLRAIWAVGLLAGLLPACLQAAKADHVGGPAGSVCNTSYHRQGCYVTSGKTPLHERMQCVDNKWKLLQICPSPLVCVERSDPTSPDSAMRYADCTVPTIKGGADTSGGNQDAFVSHDSVPAGYCSDGKCTGSENPYNCPQDCPCGDGKCGPMETPLSCPADCHAAQCGDGHCQASETKNSCPSDCNVSGGICGDGSCDMSENQNTCPQDCTFVGTCVVENCDAQLQQCLDDATCTSVFNCIAACGHSGGCADACTSGTPDGPDYFGSLGYCIAQHDCGPAVPTCGEGTCEPGETQANCPGDCSGPGWRAGCTVRKGLPGGCTNCKCQNCVCYGPIPGGLPGGDSYCCTAAWDARCAQECQMCGNCQ